MFEKILSSIGIGCAKVNTILLNEDVQLGDTLKGEVHIFGGKVDQHISEININLYTDYYKDSDDSEFHDVRKVFYEKVVATDVYIKAGIDEIIPFEFVIPFDCPVSLKAQQGIFLETDLAIDRAIDQHDLDPVVVKDSNIEKFNVLIESTGFNHTSQSGKGFFEFDSENKKKSYVQQFIYTKHKEGRNFVLYIDFKSTKEQLNISFDIYDTTEEQQNLLKSHTIYVNKTAFDIAELKKQVLSIIEENNA